MVAVLNQIPIKTEGTTLNCVRPSTTEH